MLVIPNGMDITDPAVQSNPAWKAAVTRASDLFGQAADTFESQIAAGTTPDARPGRRYHRQLAAHPFRGV